MKPQSISISLSFLALLRFHGGLEKIPRNDNFCDCSDCADEETWTCGTCGAFNEDEDQQEAQDVGADDGHGDGSHGRSHVFFAMKDPDFTMDFLRNDSIYMD